MCLAIPMRLVEVSADGTGLAEVDGVRHTVGLGLLENPRLGEYVIVHAGFAIARLDEEEANARLALFAEIAQGQAP